MTRQQPIQLTGQPAQDVVILSARIGTDPGESDELCCLLAHVREPAAGDALRRFALDESQITRAAAVAALRFRTEESSTLDAVRRALGDSQPVVVEAALRVVREASLVACRDLVRGLATAELQEHGPARAVTVGDALYTLAAMPTAADVEIGVAALEHEATRSAAVQLLAGSVDGANIEAMTPSIELHPSLLEAVCRALIWREDEGALQILARHPDAAVQRTAGEALGDLVESRRPRPLPVEQRLRPAQIEPMVNDGHATCDYRVSLDDRFNRRLGFLLNQACHVFHMHADGNWRRNYKERYAEQLAHEFAANAWLIKVLLALGDRVISSLVYRALERRGDRSVDGGS